MRRDYLFHSFFLALFLYLLYQYGCLLEPFLTPIAGAAVLAVLAYPLHRYLKKGFKKRSDSFFSAVSTFTILTVVVLPFLLMGWLLFRESQSMGPLLREWTDALRGWQTGGPLLELPWVRSLQLGLYRNVGVSQIDFERTVVQMASQLFGWISDVGGSIARNAVLALWNLFVMSFTLFFLLRDGERLMIGLNRLVPMRMEHKGQITERLQVTVTEIVRGSILTAIIQTFCATAGYLLIGIPAAITLGVATGVASFIPIFGTALVWLPLSLFYLSKGLYLKGIFIGVWGTLVVSTFDNVLRAVLIGRKAELPLLFLFFGILGGAKLYGLKGLLIGPLLVAIIPVFIDIYREQYLRKECPEPIDHHDDAL